MQDIIGDRGDPERFAAFLAGWRSILERRVAEAVAAIAAIDGVRGLILAGGIGRGAAWPLSDIDLLPIYAVGQADTSAREIEQRRAGLLARWIDEGWFTGIDIGRLAFTSDEVDRARSLDNAGLPALLADDRWYHSLDKGYGGRAVYDLDGLAAPLAAWLTAHRFDCTVVQCRMERGRAELHRARERLDLALARNDTHRAVIELQTAVRWLRARQFEAWGERDSSLARVGTRFDTLAAARGFADLATATNAVCDLDDASVSKRMTLAPAWVHERHNRSLRARHLTGEEVTRIEDARDVLRVSAQYELRATTYPPFPGWLAIPDHVETMAAKAAWLDTVIDQHPEVFL